VAAVGEALFWGFVAGSSLILGGAVALVRPLSTRLLGLVMAFGAGVLISAVAYDLVGEALETSVGGEGIALGLAAGALVFFAGDALIDSMGGGERKRSSWTQAAGSALAIVLGIVLDGIPESAVIGMGLLHGEGVGAALVVAVFISNVPEAVAATSGLTKGGWSSGRVLGLWLLVALVSGLASLGGYVLLDGASPATLAFVLAFAAGAILTMLADTMMPEAFEHGGKVVGLATTVGFGLAFALSSLE
jgi:ZIP family zinc transporter